jgi:hypothetical protein
MKWASTPKPAETISPWKGGAAFLNSNTWKSAPPCGSARYIHFSLAFSQKNRQEVIEKFRNAPLPVL